MVVMPATRIVPATAAPRLDPRLETLRDSPEISPCCASGKLDWTMFTDGVSIAPSPSPISSSPGANAHGVVDRLTMINRRAMPAVVVMKPTRISVRWAGVSRAVRQRGTRPADPLWRQ